MLGKLAGHRAHDGKIIDTLGDAGEKAAHWDPALAVLLKLPGGGQSRAVAVELRGLHFHPERLTIFGCQTGFRIESIHLGRTAIHVQKDDVADLPRIMGGVRRNRVAGSGGFGGTKNALRMQCRKGQRTEPSSGAG